MKKSTKKPAKTSKSTSAKKAASTRKTARKKAAAKPPAAVRKKAAAKAPAGARKAAKKKKPVAKKPDAKKPDAKKPTAKKPAAKKTAAKKPAAKKPARKASATAKKPAQKPSRKAAAKPAAAKKPPKTKTPAKPKLKAKEKREFKSALLAMRERLTDHVAALKNASLRRNDSVISPEDGTDVFDRQFALNLASSENESVFEIDEALRRLNDGTYGLCEECGCLIGIARLKALPFVRTCIKCQSEKEKKGPARFRPI